MAYTPEQFLKDQKISSQISGVVGGVSSILGQGLSMIDEAKSINTTAPGVQQDFLGRPVYSIGQFSVDANAIKPQGASAGEIGSGALKGASAGAVFGPVGAGVGALVGAASSALFGRRRKTLQQRKQRQAMGNLFAAQQLYNKSMNIFDSTQKGRSLYENAVDQEQRAQNLYTFN